MKKGDRVKILRKDIFHLKHRTNRNGKVIKVDGEYVVVRPNWCSWEIELYSNELKLLK
jgi:hypothetical protein